MKDITKTYTMIPQSDDYEISDVPVDRVSVGAVETYTFSNVSADHAIYVDFGIIGKVEEAAITEEVVEVVGKTEELPYTGLNLMFYLFGFALVMSGFGLIFVIRKLRKDF